MLTLEIDVNAKALIFDIDGTLADSMPIHYKAWKKTTDYYGIPFSEELFYEWAGVPATRIVQLLLNKNSIDNEVQRIADEKENNYLDLAHLIQPLMPVVDLVKKYYKVLPITAGTGSPLKVALKTLNALGLSEFFQAIVTYEDVKHPKPAPDTFLECAKIMHIDPQFCQVFEDGEPGLIAAREAGMIATDVRPYFAK